MIEDDLDSVHPTPSKSLKVLFEPIPICPEPEVEPVMTPTTPGILKSAAKSRNSDKVSFHHTEIVSHLKAKYCGKSPRVAKVQSVLSRHGSLRSALKLK